MLGSGPEMMAALVAAGADPWVSCRVTQLSTAVNQHVTRLERLWHHTSTLGSSGPTPEPVVSPTAASELDTPLHAAIRMRVPEAVLQALLTVSPPLPACTQGVWRGNMALYGHACMHACRRGSPCTMTCMRRVLV